MVLNFKEYLTEGAATNASTLFEEVIVELINTNKVDESILKSASVQAWLSKTNKKWNTVSGKTDDEVVQVLVKFKKLINSQLKGKAKGGGSDKLALSGFWKKSTGKGKDTSKADIIVNGVGISIKGPEARLMSGVKAESKATLVAALEQSDVKEELASTLISVLDDFVERVKTHGSDMTTGKIRKMDPSALSAENKKALKQLDTQKEVKERAEVAFKKAFNNAEFRNSFAWEAMSGAEKFAGKRFGVAGDATGFADSMFVWNYSLTGIKYKSKLSQTDAYVASVAKQMKIKTDVKSHSYKKVIDGVKTTLGYTISQTIDLAMTTASDQFKTLNDDYEMEYTNNNLLLSEGIIDEGKFTDAMKGVWDKVKNAITKLWMALVKKVKELTEIIKEVTQGSVSYMMNAFGLDVDVKYNNNIKF
jgi:hypothetical protein